jgi:hypothetical protein
MEQQQGRAFPGFIIMDGAFFSLILPAGQADGGHVPRHLRIHQRAPSFFQEQCLLFYFIIDTLSVAQFL